MKSILGWSVNSGRQHPFVGSVRVDGPWPVTVTVNDPWWLLGGFFRGFDTTLLEKRIDTADMGNIAALDAPRTPLN